MKKSSFIVLRPRGSGFFTKAEEATYLPSKDMESAYIPPEHLRKTPKQDPAKVVRSEIAEYYLSVRCTCLKAVYRSAPSHPERLFVCKSSLIKAILDCSKRSICLSGEEVDSDIDKLIKAAEEKMNGQNSDKEAWLTGDK